MPDASIETTKDSNPQGTSSATSSPSGELPKFDNLIDYYRFLNPRDALGRFKLPTKPSEKKDGVEIKELHEVYISSTLDGNKIIEKLFNLELPYRGLAYQTAYIDNTGRAKFLDREYWLVKSTKPSKTDTSITKDPDAGAAENETQPAAGQEIVAENYYQNVCGTKGDAPEVPVTINVFRAPFLSDSRKSTDDISLFLNHIPSYFASRMVPYFDLEMQLPRDPGDVRVANKKIIETFLDRPSIIRFLEGSYPRSPMAVFQAPEPARSQGANGRLSRVDQLMLATVVSPQAARNSGAKTGAPGAVPRVEEAYIAGMEMFTTPQTLVNMNTLKGDGKNRLNDVKPFLPPATLVSANITQQPQGITITRQATVELKIHDKARLAEFSEFLRGQAGSADITFWITYGWLAPRGTIGLSSDDDAYAKFINEKMLVKHAFMVKNVSYSFDEMGQVNVKLDLITKGMVTAEYGRIDSLGSKESSILQNIPRLIAEIKRNKEELYNAGTRQREAEEFASRDPNSNQKPINIYDVIEAAESGNLQPTLDRREILKIIKAEGIRNENTKPFNEKIDRLLRALLTIYGDYPEGEKGEKSYIQGAIENEAKDFAKSKFDVLRVIGEDPFMPDDRTVPETPEGKEKPPTAERIFSEDLLKVLRDYGDEGKPKDPSGAASGGTGYYSPCPGIFGRNTFYKINYFWNVYLSKIIANVKSSSSNEKDQKNLYATMTVTVPGYGAMSYDQIQKCVARESQDLRTCFQKHNIDERSNVAVGNASSANAYNKKQVGNESKIKTDLDDKRYKELTRNDAQAEEAKRAEEARRNNEAQEDRKRDAQIAKTQTVGPGASKI
jgi:hypothetical protein